MRVDTNLGWVLRDAAGVLDGGDEDRHGTSQRPFLSEGELDWWAFPQSWASTALGFGGIGGQAITTAQTVVVRGPAGDCAVYFGTRLAYHVGRPSDHFWECVRAWRMPEVDKQEPLHQPPEEAVAKELMGDGRQ